MKWRLSGLTLIVFAEWQTSYEVESFRTHVLLAEYVWAGELRPPDVIPSFRMGYGCKG